MKIVYTLILSAFTLFSCQAQTSEAVNGFDTTQFPSEAISLKVYEQTKRFPNNTQISFAFLNEGQETFVDVKRDNDTLSVIAHKPYAYEIGSVTKVFTSTLLAQAITEGRVSLKESITNHYNAPFSGNIEISFEQLANHTSGLPRLPSNIFNAQGFEVNNPYKIYDKASLDSYLADQLELENKSGTTYGYSNLGAGLLGQTLAQVYDTPYKKLISEKIFKVFGMKQSTFGNVNVEQFLVSGLDKDGQSVSFWDMDAMAPAGAIISTTEDLSLFVKAHFAGGNDALALSRKRTHTINNNMDIALGWHIIKAQSGQKFYWHNGATGGFTSSLAMDVDTRVAIALLSNISGLSPESGKVDQLCFNLMRLLKEE
ncbi:class C beta-lactamase-related serine hydrolase [Dokdonia sinensis]|uniref:Class C beta-lactamase-related serine hydrolase n=1 Tax=Dokdonia sinensis TaxID=2479847 RepID=A0A3M0GDU9_9FLAO|nr:serine hydrolase [Dokdonia sinensis]RMB62900.1 class C beta-lactamase-related serine hydrolase [Dokdonia sinensis]